MSRELDSALEARRYTGPDPPGRHSASRGNASRGHSTEAPPGREERSESGKKRKKGAKARGQPGKGRYRESAGEMLWRFVVKLLLVACILVAVFRFVLGVHIQHGNQMYPFVMDGDLVVTFKLEPVREGDVVAYRRPDTGKIAVSREANNGPGEIQVSGGGLTVNGSPRGASPFYDTGPLPEFGVSYPYPLSASGYFLLDDNRSVGVDSRAFGEVRKWELLGKVVYVFRRRGI